MFKVTTITASRIWSQTDQTQTIKSAAKYVGYKSYVNTLKPQQQSTASPQWQLQNKKLSIYLGSL